MSDSPAHSLTAERLKEIGLLLNRLILTASSKGYQQDREMPEEDRITDADVDGLEAKIKACIADLLADATARAQLQDERNRLFDLVRYKRAELLDDGLITREEYGRLLTEGGKNGEGSVARLGGYDSMRAQLAIQAQEIETLKADRDDAVHQIIAMNPEIERLARVETENASLCQQLAQKEADLEQGRGMFAAVQRQRDDLQQQLAHVQQVRIVKAKPRAVMDHCGDDQTDSATHHREAQTLREVAKSLTNSLPDVVLESLREEWGNTNVAVIKKWRDDVSAILRATERPDSTE